MVQVDPVAPPELRRGRRIGAIATAGAAALVLVAALVALAGSLGGGGASAAGSPGPSIRLAGTGPLYFVRGEELMRAPMSSVGELVRMRADGTGTTDVAAFDETPWGIAWSPDGSSIVFAAGGDEGSPSNIFVLRPGRTEPHPLTHFEGFDSHGAIDPAWSPDGRSIAFASDMDAMNDYELYVMRADGSDVRRLTDCSGEACGEVLGVSGPSWSPDGSRVVFARGGDLWVVGVDGSGSQRIVDGKALGTGCCRAAESPAWSPDGSTVAFVLDEDPRYSLWAVAPDGSGVHRLAACERPDCAAILGPTWSPDGRRIAFTLVSPGDIARHVAQVDADGSNLRVLTASPPDACCAAWQPVAAPAG